MSKAVQTDHEFNPEKLASLIKLAKGNRTQAEYARQCHVSLSYLSNYINKRQATPPIPSYIGKLATCANNGVSYEDMMDAAGYDHQKYIYNKNMSDYNIPPKFASNVKRYALTIIIEKLSNSDIIWHSGKPLHHPEYDFETEIENSSDIDRWNFKFLSDNNNISEEINILYGKLVSTLYAPREKVSIVTDSKSTFDKISEEYKCIIPMYISAILIDIETFTIVQEEYLSTHLILNKDLLTKYIFKNNEVNI